MEKPETIRSYLDAVASQIRWKRARPAVLRELKSHLEDQRGSFAAENAVDAERRAVEEMGDPVSVGRELDRLHRPKPQVGPLLAALLLALSCAVLRIALTNGWAAHLRADPLRTGLAVALGCGALFAGYFLDVARLAGRAVWVCAAALSAGAAAIAVSPVIHGVTYAFHYILLFYPAVFACWAYFWRGRGWHGFAFSALGGAALCLLCAAASQLFGMLLVFPALLGVLLLAAWNDWFGIGRRAALLAVFGVAVPGAAGAGFFAVRAAARLLPRMDDPAGVAAILRSVVGAARWLGEGVWETTGYSLGFEQIVPGFGDNAFPVALLYRLGWLPFLAAVLGVAGMTLWLLLRGLRLRTQLGRAVALAVGITLCTQTACSLAWNLGFPLFDVPFPLLAGNTATVLNLFLIGMALSVFRTECIAQDLPCPPRQSAPAP